MRKYNPLGKLNKEQKQAVKYINGPLLVIAGAGTGKTKVITHKVAYLIKKKIAKASEILALTFTDKAAKEMEERIDLLVPLGTYDFTATTFHSFCQDILKDYGIIAGISPDFTLLTQSQQILLIKQNLDEFKLNLYKPISNPNKFIVGLLKLFSRAKDENVSVSEYEKLAKYYMAQSHKNPQDLDLAEKAILIDEQARAYKTYERIKIANNFFDFDDLITKTLWLIKNRPSVLGELQNKYKYIFIDEFQDTNYTQAQIIYLLAKKYKNLTVVGDDDQSIYKFRGASISNIMEFLAHYPRAKKIVLYRNYRSSQQILDASYKLIKYNDPDRLEFKEKINKKLISQKSGNIPEFWQFDSNISESEEVIKYIIKHSRKEKLGSFAILVRANSYADDFITLLKNAQIPYQFVGDHGLYDREEIRELISYLKVLYNPDDNLSLFHLAWARQFRIDKLLLRQLTNHSKQKNIPLIEIFLNIAKYLGKDNSNILFIKKITDLIKYHLEYAKSWNTSKILIDYIYKSGMYQQIKKGNDYESLEKLENIKIFFTKIAEFENISKDKTLFEFVEYLNLIMESGDNPAVYQADKHEDAINLMTIHRAKGLEFETVFLPSMVCGRFPSREKKESIELPVELIKDNLPKGDFHLEEERRLFYVAITRAKKNLIFSASKNYLGNKREKKTSQFVDEALGINKNIKILTNKKGELKAPIKNNVAKDARKISKISVSPSAIETYESCPKKYEYGYIFNISIAPSQSMSFGDSIHNTLRDIYKKKTSGTNMINKIFHDNWKCQGFLSKKEEKRAYNNGLNAIIKLVKNDKITPWKIEEKFQLKLTPDIEITGRIDRVNKMINGDLEIIDYKSGDGTKKTRSEVSNNLPLWIYAINYINQNFSDIIISLYYVVNDKKISLPINTKKLQDEKNKLIEISKSLQNALHHHNFPAKPNLNNCNFCNFRQICPDKFKGIL